MRLRELFGFDYVLEMYKPAASRRWGYFALPILHGDRLIGKLDAILERRAATLRVNAVHEDEPFTASVADAVDAEIEDLARWLGVEVSRP
ncbi:DNA glycosylase AlkZ-like family protein [Microbacterium albipurpureum]|uniref:DNA glycosylase AlkZ-like family protein n=1 Tax=Microbacterium albipurpureum TaxID=3050384 RepID=UPI003BF4D433